MATKRRAAWRSTACMPLAFLAGVMLMAGCIAEPGSTAGVNDPLGALLATTAGASDVKVPAQEQTDPNSDPADGDTQTGEFEGEHQFGVDDGVEDGTNDDDQQGEFEGEHQHGDDNGDGDEDGADDDVNDGPNDQVEDGQPDGSALKATLSAGDVRADIEYGQEADLASFEVKVTGGQPDAMLDVAVNGVVVLSITLDAAGGGEFEFSSAPEDPDQQQLPVDFPSLSAGDTITVGDVSGVLGVEEDD